MNVTQFIAALSSLQKPDANISVFGYNEENIVIDYDVAGQVVNIGFLCTQGETVDTEAVDTEEPEVDTEASEVEFLIP